MNTAKRLLILWGVGALALTGCSSDETSRPDLKPKTPTAIQLTFNDDVFEANPIYSPDGQWILFESDQAGNLDIWLISVASGVVEQLTTNVSFDSSPYWSPDGSSVVFESDRSGNKNIWILDLEQAGAEPVALTVGDWDDGSPAWSPDGTRVVYESNRATATGTELWVSTVANGEALQVTNTGPGLYHRTADWSPDGMELVFESDREGGQPALYTMSALGGEAARLTPLNGYEGHPAWSPDGLSIAFEATTSGAMQVYVMDATGGDATQLTTNGGFWPRWTADGTGVVFGVYGENGEPNIWTLEIN